MKIPPGSASPRAAIMVVFAAFGAAVGSLSGSMPAITQSAGIDSFALGLGITLSTLVTVTVMSFGSALARRASNRLMTLCGIPALALFEAMLLMSSSPVAFFVSFAGAGLMMGAVDIFMNAEASAIERDVRTPIFTAFHGCVSAGVFVSAILSSLISTAIGTWATALVLCLCFAVAWMMVNCIILPRPLAAGAASRISSSPRAAPLVRLGLAAGLIMAGEAAALMWSAKLLSEQAPQLAAVAGLGAAFFGLCNAVVRFPGDMLRAWLGELPLMMISLAVAIAGFGTLGLSSEFNLSVAAFAAVGLGTAVLIPCVFALAAGFVPANRAAGIAFVSMIGGAPRTLAPWAFGWIAAGLGISTAFGFLAVGLCVALGLVATMHRNRP